MLQVNGDNFMLCIPNLAHMFYQQMTMEQEDLRQWAALHWYILLLGIYVAMTNQVCEEASVGAFKHYK